MCAGQGDVLLAEKLTQVLTRRDGRCALVATFINKVVPALETISSLRSRRSNKAAWLAAWRDQNIFFNRTHVGMAVQVTCSFHNIHTFQGSKPRIVSSQ